jgi:hypothetical protein
MTKTPGEFEPPKPITKAERDARRAPEASLDHFTQELSAQLGCAAARGVSHILINARE